MAGIFINSDSQNFWNCKKFSPTVQYVKYDVDFYTSRGGVEALFYNMNFQRMFFPTEIGTIAWKDCDFREDGSVWFRGQKLPEEQGKSFRNFLSKVRAMHEQVPDFMSIRYHYCHERGVEMWHSMRMNDVHYTALHEEFSPQHCDLWLDRKDLIRAWHRHPWRIVWSDNCLDYGIPEVYQYELSIAKEYLLGYESDGIELDWLRCCPIFKPGYDEINAGIMTQFMRDIRALCDEAEAKWGHRLRIAVRVPERAQEAIGVGMDVQKWVREGLADVVIPSCRDVGTEQDAQIQLWKMLIGKDAILAPNVDCVVYSNPKRIMEFNFESDCGFISNYYQQGADTIYFYNHFPYQEPGHPRLTELFSIAGDRKKIAALPRRHIVTLHNIIGEGIFPTLCYPDEIWYQTSNGGVKLNAGEGNAGRKAKIIFGVQRPVNVKILLNAEYCQLLPPDTPLPPGTPKKDGDCFVQAEIPAGLLHDGWNNVEVFNCEEPTIKAGEITWMEIFVE